MPPSAAKFVPLAAVLAVAIYWLYPNMMGDAPQPAKQPADAPLEFTTAILNPKFPKPPERDPFLPLISTDPVATAGAASGGPKAGGNKAGGTKAGGTKALELVLNATCIAGDRRTAIINGQIYQPKDKIGVPGDAASSYVVTDIFPDKVLLKHQGKSVSLGYLAVASGKAGKNTAGADASEKGPANTGSGALKSIFSKSASKAAK